jgi:colanic acid/amylovoran biosynthesis glycosyltransferase
MRIGAIATMKMGLEHFVYRELCFFSAAGVAISLFPTKRRPGLYNPPDHWRVCGWSILSVILAQPLCFLRAPRRYLELLAAALRDRALADVALAWYFARGMADVDLIYATFGDHKLFIGYYCKLILDKPLVVTIHAYELYANPNPGLFRRALAACDQIITVTEHNRELLAGSYGIDPSLVEVVRYSVDLEDYQSEEKFVILIVAFFTDRKGHDVLFKAVKQLGRDDIEIWVVGDAGGEEPVDARRLAGKLGVETQTAFFGKLSGNALKATYRACDVFCLPCRTDKHGVAEGFPNVLIEAMAFSKPVITTRHVEIPRIIPEILVDENDVDGLAEAIERLYLSKPLRLRLGAENRRIAEATFSPRNTEQTIAVFRRLAQAGAARPERADYTGPAAEQRP